jgi:hypothetical protein
LEGVIEFAIGEESSVAADGRAVELLGELAVESDAEGVVLAFTHGVSPSFWQKVVGTVGDSRV